MFNKGVIRKFLFLSLGFGFIIGMIFPIVASFEEVDSKELIYYNFI
ncbi:hypothetical protein GKZ28_27345 [Clostridium chromiireducens]|uniref:Uncharacterized protein n=1 Tax=Clostridium chromiireducens TaxID=225345 RepID=A0A964W5D5_9CLOT|nr:hypothetical protein [Clostridium chromiireducens]MVX67344.1 hypothetical protein [Clostridium chromiireducens]